ncbi:NERD domain-containing protein [Apilactobacillus sp. M161]|uniref:NERD domain-containing protein n=1 Tax=Apilactobacillus xinyiensis TaxID=2841032 RepID=A0ABT0HZI3_9LACO|nr:nuclease-related domain-containing protein [Apilactobacillus xinyiensis]MCK8623953.1 NERD domain-containing protein [Apilactobacillus xinyiensis]
MNLAILIYDAIIFYEYVRTKIRSYQQSKQEKNKANSQSNRQANSSYHNNYQQDYNYGDFFKDNDVVKNKISKLNNLSNKLNYVFIKSNSDSKFYDEGVSNETFIRKQPAKFRNLEARVGYNCNNLFDKVQHVNSLLSRSFINERINVDNLKDFNHNFNQFNTDIQQVKKGMDGEKRFCDKFNAYIQAHHLSNQVILLPNVKAPYYGSYKDGITKHNQIDALILTVKGIFILEIKNYAPWNKDNPFFKVNFAGRICLDKNKSVEAIVANQLLDHEGAVAKLLYELNQQNPSLNLVNNKQEVHRIVIAADNRIPDKKIFSHLGCGNIYSHKYYHINKYDRDLCHRYIRNNPHYNMKYNSVIHPIFNLEAFSIDTFINKFQLFFDKNQKILDESQLSKIADAFINQTNQIPERRQNHVIIDDNSLWIIDDYMKTLREVESLI